MAPGKVSSNVSQPLTPSVSSQQGISSSLAARYQGAIMILMWNMLVGATYGVMVYAPIAVALYQSRKISLTLWMTLLAYCTLGLLQMLYPVGGLIADVRCGRYRIISLSLFSVWLGFVFCSCFGLSYSLVAIEVNRGVMTVVQAISGGLALVILNVGYSGYQANAVHFGLDQLPDVSSEVLSLFLHWFVWAETVGEAVIHILITATPCDKVFRKSEGFLSILFLAISTLCIVVSCCMRRKLHCTKIVSNPYRNVYKVLKFASKHKQPLGRRSALTFSDDYRPRRMDFAKRIYGGPFETEVVEDVKTFLRIILMLLTITTIFSFEVSTSYLFPIFGRHIGRNGLIHDRCTYKWMLFESGTLSHIFPILGIPLYITLVYPHVKKWIPRILYRMGIGLALKVMSVILMFGIQVAANSNATHNNATANFTCLFLSAYHDLPMLHDNITNPEVMTLGLSSQLLVILNLLNGIAAPIVAVTALEFISAQSPHTMKGVLLGVFYAFRGLFIILGCVITFPFAHESLWANRNGIFDCGFYYYLCNSVLSLIGLVVFVKAARWYRYRTRDDPPYGHQYAEEYYSRYIGRLTTRLLEEETQDYGSV